MSVRIDAVGDYLSRTTGAPGNDPFTFCCWLYLVDDRNATGTVFILANSTGATYLALSLFSNGTSLRCVTSVGGTNGTNLSLATWYHVAYTRNGASQKSWLNGVNDASRTDTVSFTSANLYLGNDTVNWISGRIYAAKIWTAELTQDEIKLERETILPRRFANLYGFWPMLPGSGERARDYGGGGFNFTENGTLTDEDAPPVAWGTRRFFIINPISVAGGVTQSGAAALTAVANLSNTARMTARGVTNVNAFGNVTSAARMTAQGTSGLNARSDLTSAMWAKLRAIAPLSAVANLTSTAKVTLRGTAIISGVSSLQAIAALRAAGAAVLTGTGTLTPQGRVTLHGTVSLLGTATLTASSVAPLSAAAALATFSNLTVNGTVRLRGTAALSGISSVAPNARSTFRGTSSVNAASDVLSVARLIMRGVAKLDGVSSVSSAALARREGTAALNVTASFAPDGRLILRGGAALAGTASFAASGKLTIRGTALLESFANLIAVGSIAAGAVIYAVIELEIPERSTALSLRSRMLTLIIPVRDIIFDLHERSTEGELFERSTIWTAGKW